MTSTFGANYKPYILEVKAISHIPPWTKQFCTFETGYGAYGKFQTPIGIKENWLPWWSNLLDEYCMFVDYDEEDDMPELLISVVDIPYVKTEAYSNAIKGIIEVGDFATTMEKIVAIGKAHQVCNGYIYLPDKVIHRYGPNKKIRIFRRICYARKMCYCI